MYALIDIDETNLPEVGDLLQVISIDPPREGCDSLRRLQLEPLNVRLLVDEESTYEYTK